MIFKPAVQTAISHDLLASVVVFLVALPLCMGVSIASGLPPTAGIITGIIGGVVVGTIAGSPLQVSGPAAGLTVLVWQLVQQYGVETLGIIVLLAGLLQMLAGSLKLGQWFRAVSPAVIHGMLAGIGVLIFASQFHVMLDHQPLGSGVRNLAAIPEAVWDVVTRPDEHLVAGEIGLMTIAVAVCTLLKLEVHYVEVPNSIMSVTVFPTLDMLKRVFEAPILIGAVSVAFIASAETLLCATAVDQMHQGPRTKYDKELFAQGVGNTLCGALGVLPMTGVIVRSGANVEAGAKSRVSTILHGFWLLVFVSALPFTLRYIPTSSLAAVLVFTGYKLAYPKAVPDLLKYGKTKVAIYAVTVLTIVFTSLLEGVVLGLVLSLIKLLHAVSHLEIRKSVDAQDGAGIHLHLKGAATLIRLPLLASTLEALPPSSEVHVHIEDLDYIDHACLDLLSNWERQHMAAGGTLVIEWEVLRWKYHQRRSGNLRAPRAVAGASEVVTGYN
jgi:MFS superfamily sulfate permease-like transporter